MGTKPPSEWPSDIGHVDNNRLAVTWHQVSVNTLPACHIQLSSFCPAHFLAFSCFFPFKSFFYYQITDFHTDGTTEKKVPIFVGFDFYILLKSTLK